MIECHTDPPAGNATTLPASVRNPMSRSPFARHPPSRSAAPRVLRFENAPSASSTVVTPVSRGEILWTNRTCHLAMGLPFHPEGSKLEVVEGSADPGPPLPSGCPSPPVPYWPRTQLLPVPGQA